MRFELGKWFERGKWGDGTIRLAHLDSLRGDDIVIRLEPDGMAWLCDESGQAKTWIDLAMYLRSLAAQEETPEAL